jgi:FkbM family methyltransferase
MSARNAKVSDALIHPVEAYTPMRKIRMFTNLIPPLVRVPLRRYTIRGIRAVTGNFPYYNQRVYTPRGSVIFERILQFGTFEPEILLTMQSLAKKDTIVLDIGANIGVMSIALLQLRQDISVVSIECSPSTLPFLRKTFAASPHHSRWRIIEVAVGEKDGKLPFFTAGRAMGAYDGLKDTCRGGPTTSVAVKVKKLDQIWEDLSCPEVSLIKIDIEGGEFDALSGAARLMAKCQPYILFEWNEANLTAYNRKAADLFQLRKEGYELFTLPSLQRVKPSLLPIMMAQTEMFLLAPAS